MASDDNTEGNNKRRRATKKTNTNDIIVIVITRLAREVRPGPDAPARRTVFDAVGVVRGRGGLRPEPPTDAAGAARLRQVCVVARTGWRHNDPRPVLLPMVDETPAGAPMSHCRSPTSTIVRPHPSPRMPFPAASGLQAHFSDPLREAPARDPQRLTGGGHAHQRLQQRAPLASVPCPRRT